MKLGRKAVAIGVVGLLALTACGRADDDSTGGETSAGSTTTVDDAPAEGDITIWAMGEEGEKLPDFVQGFTEENPDANVEVTTIPWADVMTKFQTAVAAGTVPDAIMIGSSFMPTMVATGGLAPVPEGLVDNDDFVEGAAASTVADGVAYGVPWYVETRVLYYRSDLAQAAGVEAPTSWEELTAFAEAMKANGSTYGLQLPMGDAEDSTQVILPFYSQAGGSVLNEAGDGFDLDNQAMVDALDYYASFFTEGLSPLSGYGDSQNSAFVDGSDPAFISGPWMVNVLADLQGEDWVEQNVATVPVPAGSANNDSYIGGAHLGVFAEAKNADGAWKLHPLALRARDAAGVVRRDERPARAEQRVGLRGAHLEPPHPGAPGAAREHDRPADRPELGRALGHHRDRGREGRERSGVLRGRGEGHPGQGRHARARLVTGPVSHDHHHRGTAPAYGRRRPPATASARRLAVRAPVRRGLHGLHAGAAARVVRDVVLGPHDP
nr:extracellular solute-binding protein [Cellulosimicrobium sp. MM]